jgi:hypothetical protein
MESPKYHGRSPGHGRRLFSLGVSSLGDLSGRVTLASPHFIALIACDTHFASVDEMSAAGAWLLSQGAVVISTWGPGCEKFHDVIDETDLEVHPDETDDTVVLTTWHDSESLASALWFAVNTIGPARAYEQTCTTVMAISVGNSTWLAEIEDRLAHPQRLTDSVLAISESSGNP